MEKVVVLREMLPIVYHLGGTQIDGGFFVMQGLRMPDEGNHKVCYPFIIEIARVQPNHQ